MVTVTVVKLNHYFNKPIILNLKKNYFTQDHTQTSDTLSEKHFFKFDPD